MNNKLRQEIEKSYMAHIMIHRDAEVRYHITDHDAAMIDFIVAEVEARLADAVNDAYGEGILHGYKQCQDKMRKDETPFKVGDRVWSIEDGFGVIKVLLKREVEILYDEHDRSITWYHSISLLNKTLFHANDPVIRIFGVEPEEGKK